MTTTEIPAAGDTQLADAAFARGARILSIGIAATGVFTFAYFGVASHVLDKDDYGAISTLWAILFVTISVIYRPVEQLLSRSIADRRARGLTEGHQLRTPVTIQLTFAAVSLVVALALHSTIRDKALNGSDSLYWVLVAATMAYAASYFARGYLAGHQWFGLYGGLVLFESVSRFLFPVGVAIGVATGQTAVALGIVAAPFASLLVVPWALTRHVSSSDVPQAAAEGTVRASAGFAASVALIQLSEQTLISIGVLLVPDASLRGVVFNALLIARAPLQLFQAIQTSLLPHLTRLTVGDRDGDGEGDASFAQTIRLTVLAILAFAGVVGVGLLVIGPFAMDVVFGKGYHYGRVGLAVVALGMGFHLISGTLNQAALARGAAARAAVVWLGAAVLFVAWMAAPLVSDRLVRAETGYAGATAVLAVALWALYRTARAPAAA